MNPKYITVHCAYTKPSMDIGVKEIRDWHVNGNGWCFSLDTEVLTDNGWRTFETIERSDKVFTYQDGFVNDWEKLHWKDNDTYRISTRNFDAILTPNHKIVSKPATNKHECYKTIEVEDVLSKTTVQAILTSAVYDGSWESPVDVSVATAIITDGYFNFYTPKEGAPYPISIGWEVKKERKVIFLEKILKKSGIPYKKTEKNDKGYTKFHVYDRETVNAFFDILCVNGRGSKALPIEFIHLSISDKKRVIDAYLETDGIKDTSKYKKQNKYQSISSAVEQNIDIMQSIIHLSGMRGKKTFPKMSKDSKNVKPLTNLSINARHDVQLDLRNAKVSKNNQDVWSVDCGGRWIMVRYNGCVQITSNSDVGYHGIIRRDGTVEDGRPYDVQGAHVGGHNANNLGICLIGGMKEDAEEPEDNFTPKQFESLVDLLDDLMEKFNIPKENVKAHNEWSGAEGRSCPCFDFEEFISENFSESESTRTENAVTITIPKGIKEITFKFE